MLEETAINYTITLSPEIYSLVQQQAQQAHTTPTVLVETALRQYLLQQETVWQQAFLSLVARVQDYTHHFDPQDIEADITAAALEVEELRHAHRGSEVCKNSSPG